MAEHSAVDLPECEDSARRKKLEADPIKWLRHYLHLAYERPFERPHLAIIDGAIHASATGGRFAIAAQRGIGKSTVLWGIVLMLAITGKQPFPVCVPWASGALKRAFRFWKTALCFNERLFSDYPEVCAPFRHSKGSPQKIAHTTWRATGKPTGAQLAVGEGLIVLPDNRGCIGGATINGNPRGLNHPMPDGRVLRPTLALLDDVQDRGTAKSELQVRETIEVIDGDVAGMGEAGTNLPMLMSGNCIEPHDVMAHYLGSDRWKAVRVPCIEEWPDGWKDGSGEAFQLWKQWHDLYRDGSGAATFYKKHKAKMTKGMKLSAPGTFKKAAQIPDTFCGVMVNYFKMGAEAFAAEARRRFGDWLGALSLEGRRFAYPLEIVQADALVAERVALAGDAAHAIHPIAGQGFNLGLRDVAALAECVVDAARLGLDIGGGEVLERYQRWRRVDNMSLLAVTDLLNRLFSNDQPTLRLARRLGLAAVERVAPLKRLFMRHAMGVVGDLPRLVRGERL